MGLQRTHGEHIKDKKPAIRKPLMMDASSVIQHEVQVC
jgi:hypothetical protein